MYIYNEKIDKTVDSQGEEYFSRIGKTVYLYTADEKSIKIYKDDPDNAPGLKFEFKGNYIGKKCCFRIDQKGRFKFLGEAKPPKDPIKKLFWEYGFTGSRRVDSYSDINNSLRSSFYMRGGRCFTDLSGEDTDKIIVALEPDTKTWYASKDLTLEEAKRIMEMYEEGLKTKQEIINMLHTDNGVRLAGKHMIPDDLD